MLTDLPVQNLLGTKPSAAPQPDKLHNAAQQFEALFLSEMLKSARESGGGWLGSGESTGDDSAMDLAESQLANAFASGKGLGLAGMIERTMRKSLDQKVADTPANSAVSPK
jgi:peptidoglycan hydrolase FlgJ